MEPPSVCRTMKRYFSPCLPLCCLLQTELNLCTRISAPILADWVTGGPSRKIRSFLCSTNNCLLIPRHLWASVLCAALRTWRRSHRPCSLVAHSLMGGMNKQIPWLRAVVELALSWDLQERGRPYQVRGEESLESPRHREQYVRRHTREHDTRGNGNQRWHHWMQSAGKQVLKGGDEGAYLTCWGVWWQIGRP